MKRVYLNQLDWRELVWFDGSKYWNCDGPHQTLSECFHSKPKNSDGAYSFFEFPPSSLFGIVSILEDVAFCVEGVRHLFDGESSCLVYWFSRFKNLSRHVLVENAKPFVRDNVRQFLQTLTANQGIPRCYTKLTPVSTLLEHAQRIITFVEEDSAPIFSSDHPRLFQRPLKPFQFVLLYDGAYFFPNGKEWSVDVATRHELSTAVFAWLFAFTDDVYQAYLHDRRYLNALLSLADLHQSGQSLSLDDAQPAEWFVAFFDELCDSRVQLNQFIQKIRDIRQARVDSIRMLQAIGLKSRRRLLHPLPNPNNDGIDDQRVTVVGNVF